MMMSSGAHSDTAFFAMIRFCSTLTPLRSLNGTSLMIGARYLGDLRLQLGNVDPGELRGAPDPLQARPVPERTSRSRRIVVTDEAKRFGKLLHGHELDLFEEPQDRLLPFDLMHAASPWRSRTLASPHSFYHVCLSINSSRARAGSLQTVPRHP